MGALRITALLAIIAGVYTVDMFLARTERVEVRRDAESFYQQGRARLQKGDAPGAVEAFRRAHELERTDRAFQLGLAEALIATRRYDKARENLADLLQRDGNNGEANLLMARSLAQEGDSGAALPFYHRALYGAWDSDAAARRIATRWEIVDTLVQLQKGSRQDLLAELLPLETEIPPQDVPARARLGKLYLLAGSASRAAEIFRDLSRQQPGLAEYHESLGEAELARGNFRAAQSAFLHALVRDSNNQQYGARLHLASKLITLDPTARRLSAAEKDHRATELLGLAVQLVTSCEPAPVAAREWLEQADQLQNQRAKRSAELVEEKLDLVQKLWAVDRQHCPSPSTSPARDLLGPLVAKLGD